MPKKEIEKVNRNLAILIASRNLPLSIVESASFIRFSESLNISYAIPSRPEIRKLIIQIAEEEQQSLTHDFKLMIIASISVDIWTSMPNDPYLGIIGWQKSLVQL